MYEAKSNPICLIPVNFTLFSHLNKSAADNILFLFTNARSTQYAPGDTGPALVSLLKQIKERPPHVDILYNKQTIYCFDNEAFRFAVASAPPNNMIFDDLLTRDYEVSWMGSVRECDRLMERIISLKPHQVMETLSLNNAKQSILLLTQPLADIAKNISDNVKACEQHKKKVSEFKGNITEFEKELYVPWKDIESDPLNEPKTVCNEGNCIVKETINGTVKIHYKTDCHSPCYLTHSDGNVMGNVGLLDCIAFNKYESIGEGEWRVPTNLVPDQNVTLNAEGKAFLYYLERTKSDNCFKCGHSFQSHLHIKYETRIVNKKIRDEKKYKSINTAKEAAAAKQAQIVELEARIKELTDENTTISICMAKFACFLSNNALTPFNDAFEGYVKDAGKLSGGDSKVTIDKLQQMLDRYKYEKDAILAAMKKGKKNESAVSVEDIDKLIKQLCSLKVNGPAISQLLDTQIKSKAKSHTFNEKVINTVSAATSKLSGFRVY
ncbi:unnamed protein product [Oppiella nova]|uniref:DUF8206 domain-containing protein n=1 Tax=Oppiella nova TaxID=334625 RepID=A0A7R9QF82_9ACAR|nr:unnamed protein product [Oppiella nova]CAG2164728.1 unnamed protein product [Oppiella nova]